MKGIVFTGFLEMVENKFGIETVDSVLENLELESNGVYTTVGTYDFSEMVKLLEKLSQQVHIPVNDLIYTYGLYFFSILTASYPEIFKMYGSAFEMLKSVHDHIHVQVRKIYPEAELPAFQITHDREDYLEMIYTSERGMYKFAQALIEKTCEFYRKDASITYTKLHDDGTKVKFMIS
jgi:hypothetical protein